MGPRASCVLLVVLAGCGTDDRAADDARRPPPAPPSLAVPPAPSGPAVRVGPVVRLPGGVEDVEGGRDGSVRAVTSSLSPSANARLTLLGSTWRDRRSVQELPEQRAGDSASSALTPTGVVTAYRSTADRIRRIDLVDSRENGARSGARAISGRARSAKEPQVFAGGGAVAVLFKQRIGNDDQVMLTFRPAGSARFGAPVGLDPAGADLGEYVLVLGPDGSGAVVAGPSFIGVGGDQTVRVRRIGRDGALGPWLQVGSGRYESGVVRAAASDDGTIVIAMAMDDPDGATATVQTSSLAPGQSTTTPVQVLATRAGVELVQDNLSLAIGASNQTVLATAGVSPRHIDVFTGPAHALTRTGTFKAHDPTGTLATVTSDGGTTVVWPGSTTEDGGGPLLVSHRPPGGIFSTPAPAARTRFHREFGEPGAGASPAGMLSADLVPVGPDAAALAYYDRYTHHSGEAGDGFNAYLVRLRP